MKILKKRCIEEKTQKELFHEEKKDYGERKPVQMPKIKKQRTVSIKTINTETTWQLETTGDVKKYVAELEKKLLSIVEEDTIINIEF